MQSKNNQLSWLLGAFKGRPGKDFLPNCSQRILKDEEAARPRHELPLAVSTCKASISGLSEIFRL